MPRLLLLWALIVLLPVINLRMICIDHSVESSPRMECTDVCPRTPAKAEEETPGCVLVPGGCSAVAALVIALPTPSPVTLTRPGVNVVATVTDPDLYLPPSASPLSPPPKA